MLLNRNKNSPHASLYGHSRGRVGGLIPARRARIASGGRGTGGLRQLAVTPL